MMNHDPTEAWRQLLDTGRLPAWLEGFSHDPYGITARILAGDMLLGGLSPDESVDSLVDWISVLGDVGGFVSLLDQSVARLVADAWGVAGDADRAVALGRAFDLIAESPQLESAGAKLRDAVSERATLDLAPAGIDLLGRYLNALAVHQTDRQLIPLWHTLAELPTGTIWHAGRYAVRGMEVAPALPPEDGAFRHEVAQVAVEVVRSLTRKVVEGELDSTAAHDEQRAIAQLCFSSNPGDQGWRQAVGDSLLGDAMYEDSLRDVFAFLRLPALPTLESSSDLPDPGGWAREAKAIAADLLAGAAGAFTRAQKLLATQRAYAVRTGQPSYVVLSLSNFAGAVRGHDPGVAESWSREAIWWQPSEASGWTALVGAIALGEPVRAVELAWSATARFPENVNAWTVLARALGRAKLFDTASLIERYIQRRFDESASFPMGDGKDDPASRAQLLDNSPTALLGEARVRRRESYVSTDAPATRLSQARDLIARVKQQWPEHRALNGEAALCGVPNDLAGDAVNGYLEARELRESRRGTRIRSDTEIDALVAPWKRLRERDVAATPASLLGRGRACLAAVDGDGLDAEALHAFSRLASWGAGHRRSYPTNTFESNWLERVDSVIDLTDLGATKIQWLRAAEAINRATLDELEEDAVVPIERSAEFDPSAAAAAI
jgi:hypothetical protein